jgi:hypothetical protein
VAQELTWDKKKRNCRITTIRARVLWIPAKLRGCSQPSLAFTDDGWYVIKWQQNPQHRRILINEVAAAEILSLLGIATAPWAMLYVDQKNISGNPNARIQLRNGSISPEPGWHFGSKVPVNPATTAIYESLPSLQLRRVRNLHHLVAALAFDYWVDNKDSRQLIFYRGDDRRFALQLIDNGSAFGFDGADWSLSDRSQVNGPQWMKDLCGKESSRLWFRYAIDAIQAITESDLHGALRSVPHEWMGTDRIRLDLVAKELLRRGRRLPEIIRSDS